MRTASDMASPRVATDTSASRLAALPNELLHRVVRTAGRPIRRVCRLFRTAYGPLDAGLCLEHFSSGHELLQLLAATHPDAFRHIRALLLHPRPSNLNPLATLLTPLPTAFPALRSLHLGSRIILLPPHFSALAPLAPHLTALTATIHHASAAPLATILTSLRSLSLACRPDMQPGTDILTFMESRASSLLPSLRPLAPTLLHLSLATASYSPDGVLPPLATFTGIVHLDLSSGGRGTHCVEWTTEATNLLATAMPHLQLLHCGWEFRGTRSVRPPPDAPTTEDVLTALAARTALTSLSLTLSNVPYTPLHPLRLRHLSVHQTLSAMPGSGCLCDLLQIVSQSQTLTSLDVSHSTHLPSLFQGLPLLWPTLRILTWHMPSTPCPPAALLPLSQLTSLESLHLTLSCHTRNPPECLTEGQAATIANALTRLTSLTLDVTPADCNRQYPLAALVRQVACRGTLRHLALDCWGEALLARLATSLVRLSVTMSYLDVWESMRRLGHLQVLRSLCIKVSWLMRHGSEYLQGQAASSSAAHGPGSQTSTTGGGAGASGSKGVAAGAGSSSSKGGTAAAASSRRGVATGASSCTTAAANASGSAAAAGCEAGGLGRQSTRPRNKKGGGEQAAEGGADGSVQQAGHGSSEGRQGQSVGQQGARGRHVVQQMHQAGRGGAGQQGPEATQQAAGRSAGGSRPTLLPPGLRQLCLDVSYGNRQGQARFPVEPVWAEVLAAAARQDCAVRTTTEMPPLPLSSWRPAAVDDCHGYQDGAAAGFIGAGGCR